MNSLMSMGSTCQVPGPALGAGLTKVDEAVPASEELRSEQSSARSVKDAAAGAGHPSGAVSPLRAGTGSEIVLESSETNQ